MTVPVYAASRIRRYRRTGAELALIYDAIYRISEADEPMTLRGLFYRLVSDGLIPKQENEYDKTGRYLLKLRREGIVPYDWIADSTRWMRKPRTYGSLEEALAHTAHTYRRAVWDDQPSYVELWCEKDTLAGALYQETEPWDVPLLVCRGFTSETYVYSAAEAIRAYDRPTCIYLLTDHDPSGVAIARHVERRIRAFLPESEIHVERIAVMEAQIVRWHLSTRPTKASDSRSKGFRGESVELDAIPPATLRALVRACIERHIDEATLAQTRAVERLERVSLAALIDGGLVA